MATQSLNFGGSVSQNYEDYLGPFFFEPFAADLATRLNYDGVNVVLELACGTGRLTNHINQNLPHGVSFVATDLNPDMLAVAKTKVASANVEFKPADMMALPFGDASVDLVVCQFGIMLVPDQDKALQEIYRVLKPRGKLVFNTWSDLGYNKVWAIGDAILQDFLPDRKMTFNPGPFALGDAGVAKQMLLKARFSAVDTTTVETTGEIDSAEKAAYGFVHGLPVINFIQKNGPEQLPEILKVFAQKLRDELGDHPLKTPQKALVFEAEK